VPGGLDNPVVGFTVFAAVKLAGYSAFCHYRLARSFPEHKVSSIAAGATRTVIGVGFGLLYTVAIMAALAQVLHDALIPIGILGLIPVRLLEWWILIKIFYARGPAQDGARSFTRDLWYGVACSFALDVPSWLGLVALGKVFIC
jgi:hypothetical protein